MPAIAISRRRGILNRDNYRPNDLEVFNLRPTSDRADRTCGADIYSRRIGTLTQVDDYILGQ